MEELFNKDNILTFPVHEFNYIGKKDQSLEEMFSGYNKLYVMTYSYSISFLEQILKWFDYAEIVLGIIDIDDNDIWNIGALQMTTMDEIKPYITQKQYNIYKMCKEEKLKIYCSPKISHGKLFLLENDDKSRVITGSANASLSAFSGKQNEIIFNCNDDIKCYEEMIKIFNNTRDHSSEPLPLECFNYENNKAKFSDTEVFKKVIKADTVIINDIGSNKEKNVVDMLMDLKKNKQKVEEILTENELKREKGKLLLLAQNFKKIKQKEQEINSVEREDSFNLLTFDINEKKAFLNGEDLFENIDLELAKKDIMMFEEFLEGFKKYEFSGDVDNMIDQYYRLMNYMFVSPFFAIFRNTYLKRDQRDFAIDSFPLFAVIYGQSGGGKTKTIRLIQKMMSKYINSISYDNFTSSYINNVRTVYKGLPVYIDDVKSKQWTSNADGIIKYDEFGKGIDDYSCFIISLNNIGNVTDELKRRALMFLIECRHNDEKRQAGIGDKLGKKITNNFYKLYLKKMLNVIPELLQHAKSNEDNAIDLFNVSSKIICELAGDNIKYLRELTWSDYFGSRVVNSKGINDLHVAYLQNKRKFKIEKRNNRVIFINEVQYESQNKKITDELPSSYEAKPTKFGITMKYDELKKDFLKKGTKI